jgi:hypothetical protein
MANNRPSHLIISKLDGSIAKDIQMPFKDVKTPILILREATLTPIFNPTIPGRNNWILANTSSDTIYSCLPDGDIRPLIIRTPSIQSMEPETFLFPLMVTNNYYLMTAMKKEYDSEKMKGFPKVNLLYDKQENSVFQYTVYNNDLLEERIVWFIQPINHEIANYQRFDAYFLVDGYEKGILKGKLKEIAAGLNEESNPVIMLIKHKQQ